MVQERLIAHEWGTFTSFSGSNGVPVGFHAEQYRPAPLRLLPGQSSLESGPLHQNGLVSMETPVLYFYTDREMKVSVKVDFPRGWITEWYPFAAAAPNYGNEEPPSGGQSIRWDARLLPGEPLKFPGDQSNDKNHYYHARETDAVPLQIESRRRIDANTSFVAARSFNARSSCSIAAWAHSRRRSRSRHSVADKVRVRNAAGRSSRRASRLSRSETARSASDPLDGHQCRGGSRGAHSRGKRSAHRLVDHLVKDLTAAGLYEKEAQAMVKTWDAAWFGEEGTRLLYLVPRAKTDELLPLTVEPKPTEVVRVLVGRHDFLTPEQEAIADQQLQAVECGAGRIGSGTETAKLGRFSFERVNSRPSGSKPQVRP